MVMHYTGLALANSWLVYRMTGAAQVHMTKYDTDAHCVQEEDAHPSQAGHKCWVSPALSCTTSATQLPEMVNLKNPMCCIEKGCTGNSRVWRLTCKVFPFLQKEGNYFAHKVKTMTRK